MKKSLAILALATASYMPLVSAADTDAANVNIKISGALADNRYFLCLPDVGCLSILAAEKKAKVYPIFHSFDMDKIFVANLNSYRIYPQGLPASCNVTVNTNQTITIYGKLVNKSDQQTYVENLHCTVS
ncbi:MAG: hypothetical protein EPO11_02070 [Gammaproteobacteria bacterium]|nr:MAG: hypothetical protein EPO11_02070 [Gammaproteobacteria bacterium]